MKNAISFGGWDNAIHELPDQVKRIATAKKSSTTPTSVDKNSQSAVFPGSGKQPYETTLSDCTCVDFSIRRLPCKHIYRLAMELGLLDTGFSAGLNKNMAFTIQETVSIMENYTDDQQLFIMHIIRQINAFGTYEEYLPAARADLLTCPLFSFAPLPLRSALEDCRKDDILARLEKIDKVPQSKMLKADLIAYCCDNVPELADLLPTKYSICAAEKFQKAIRKTLEYLRRKYEMTYDYTEDGTRFYFPVGAVTAYELAGNILGLEGLYCFPNDEITVLLSYYGHNKCQNGFVPILEK